MPWRRTVTIVDILLALPAAMIVTATVHVQSNADVVVQQLRDLPTPLPASGPSDGSIRPSDQRRHDLYEQLVQLGNDGVLALSRALKDNDVRLRKNAALALGALGGGWFEPKWPKVDIRSGLPGLIAALKDVDGNVRGWSAQAIGSLGANGAPAVPSLITLLTNADEGSKNSACIALRGIGPAAKTALPALRSLSNDPSPDVRRFAELAIDSIQQ